MSGHTLFTNRFIITCVALLLLAGCKAKSLEYVNENEIPSGPGVFSGENGEWTIYDSERKQQATANEEKPAAEDAKQDHEADSADAAADYEEFRQYQEWKKEQQEFQDYQEWKKSSQGTREYQEFQQWREWKQFKEWQNQQEHHD